MEKFSFSTKTSSTNNDQVILFVLSDFICSIVERKKEEDYSHVSQRFHVENK